MPKASTSARSSSTSGDWGALYGLAFGIARAQDPFETIEQVAERAGRVAREVYDDRYGALERPKVDPIVRAVVREYVKTDLPSGPLYKALHDLAEVVGSLMAGSTTPGRTSADKTRRSYGTGRVYTREEINGRETYYGSWWAGDKRVNRKLGAKRAPGERDGLTATQAEAELRRRMADDGATAKLGERIDIAELGRRYRRHLEAQGRKKATLTAVDSTLNIWINPVLGDRETSRVTPEDVEDLMRTMGQRLGPKSIRNHIGTLSAMYRHAMHPRRKWATVNPCEAIDLPAREDSEEIRFLTPDEVEQLANAAVPGEHQSLDRALYLTAAMTGLRQGELIALRWQDVDWRAQRIRVRRSHVLGEFGTPKSKRSTRSVPMSTRVAGELDRWHQETKHKATRRSSLRNRPRENRCAGGR